MTQSGRDLAACIVSVAATHSRDDFAVLFTHFAPRLQTYFVRQGISPALAEDLAQETMLRVWRKAAHFDAARGTPAAWVFAIARNLRRDATRSDRQWSSLGQQPLAVLGELPGTEDGVDSAQREQQLARALDELPGDQLELVRLSFFYGMSHVEIERKVGLPLGTIKSRIRRALQQLRMILNSKL